MPGPAVWIYGKCAANSGCGARFFNDGLFSTFLTKAKGNLCTPLPNFGLFWVPNAGIWRRK